MSTNSGSFELQKEFGVTRREILLLTGAAFTAPWLAASFPREASAICSSPAIRTARAIVIGIDGYDAQFGSLPRCVEHAVAFTKWLIKADVSDANITLLTRRKQDGAIASLENTAVKCLEATGSNLAKCIRDVLRDVGNVEGERLFFFFSGHGVCFEDVDFAGGNGSVAAETNSARDTIIMADGRPITVDDIRDALGTANFIEQFYFIDACRKIETDNPDLLEGVTLFHQKDKTQVPGCVVAKTKIQYVMNATQPNKLAPANNFATEKLLASLNDGVGNCLDQEGEKYLLRWKRLKEYFLDYFGKHPFNVEGQDYQLQPDFVQFPLCDHLHSPCLMEFPAEAVKRREFKIKVEAPGGSLVDAQYQVTFDADGTLVAAGPVPSDGIVMVSVRPGEHNIEVTLQNLVRRIKSFDADEDGDNQPFVVQVLNAGASSGGGPKKAAKKTYAPPGPPEPVPVPSQMAEFDAQTQGSCDLLVYSKDPLARLELFDGSGKPVLHKNDQACTALGGMKIRGLLPGVYKATAQSTFGTEPRFTSVERNESASIVFREPHTAALAPRHAENRVGWEPPAPNVALGPGAFLAEALRATNNQNDAALVISKRYGLGEFPGDAKQGIRIVLAIGLDGPDPTWESLKDVTLLTAGLDGDDFQKLPIENCQVEGAGTVVAVRDPGPFRLRIERRKKDDKVDVADFAFVVLPDRVTDFIIEQSVEGSVRITHFLPSTRSDAPNVEYAAVMYQMEHDLQNGPFQRAPLLYDKMRDYNRADPVCLLLGADMMSPYSTWRRPTPADADERAELARTLVDLVPALPDGHVLLGTLAEEAGRPMEEARQHYLAALERGLPILTSNLKLLRDGAARCQVDHPRLALVKTVWGRIIAGPLWTAWRPPRA